MFYGGTLDVKVATREAIGLNFPNEFHNFAYLGQTTRTQPHIASRTIRHHEMDVPPKWLREETEETGYEP